MTDVEPWVYRTAADRICRGGLAKGNYSAGHSYCTLGAIGYNNLGHTEAQARAGLLADLLGLPAPTRPVSGVTGAAAIVAAWNDNPLRTAADVITLLEQAAEKLEANRP